MGRRGSVGGSSGLFHWPALVAGGGLVMLEGPAGPSKKKKKESCAPSGYLGADTWHMAKGGVSVMLLQIYFLYFLFYFLSLLYCLRCVIVFFYVKQVLGTLLNRSGECLGVYHIKVGVC